MRGIYPQILLNLKQANNNAHMLSPRIKRIYFL